MAMGAGGIEGGGARYIGTGHMSGRGSKVSDDF